MTENHPTEFLCPDCGSGYKVVRVKADADLPHRDPLQGLQTPAYGDGRAACTEIFPCPARSEATAIKKAPQGTRGLEWTRSKPRGALGHDSSVTGLCDRVMKGGGLFPMARQIALGRSLAPPALSEPFFGVGMQVPGRSNSHRSGISPLFFRVNSSSGDALFFIINLSQAAIFSAESSLSEHRSFCCSTA